MPLISLDDTHVYKKLITNVWNRQVLHFSKITLKSEKTGANLNIGSVLIQIIYVNICKKITTVSNSVRDVMLCLSKNYLDAYKN